MSQWAQSLPNFLLCAWGGHSIFWGGQAQTEIWTKGHHVEFLLKFFCKFTLDVNSVIWLHWSLADLVNFWQFWGRFKAKKLGPLGYSCRSSFIGQNLQTLIAINVFDILWWTSIVFHLRSMLLMVVLSLTVYICICCVGWCIDTCCWFTQNSFPLAGSESMMFRRWCKL